MDVVWRLGNRNDQPPMNQIKMQFKYNFPEASVEIGKSSRHKRVAECVVETMTQIIEMTGLHVIWNFQKHIPLNHFIMTHHIMLKSRQIAPRETLIISILNPLL